MRAIVIRPYARVEVRDVEGGDELRAILGGSLGGLMFLPGTNAYIDDMGKIHPDRPPVYNGLATWLCGVVGHPLRHGDWVPGTVVVFGSTLDGSDDRDVPDDVVSIVRDAEALYRRMPHLVDRVIDVMAFGR